MTFNIGMVGASGAGKTSLMTAMFLDMKARLLANKDTMNFVHIRYEDKETKLAIRDSKERFDSCIRMAKFLAWERSSQCGTFGFNVEFGIGDKSKTFKFKIMDYPGGMLSDKEEFGRVCLPHIENSCALFVPIDAVALMKYDEETRAGSADAAAMLKRFELEHVFEIVRVWSESKKRGAFGVVFLVPVKTESYFTDNGCSSCDRSDQLRSAVQRVYVDEINARCGTHGIRIVYNPVDTYGCVSLNSANWNRAANVIEEEFLVVKDRGLSIRGAVDLFTEIVKETLSDQRRDTMEKSEKGRSEINDRGVIKKVYYHFFPDFVKQRVEENEKATAFYDAALNAMVSFSSTDRIQTV